MKSSTVQNPAAPRTASSTRAVSYRHRVEYWAVAGVLGLLGWLPHRAARGVCGALAALAYWFWPRLRHVGLFNLRLAFPEWTERQRRRVLRGVFRNFGRMLADFARFPQLSCANIERLIIYDGFEHYAQAREQGKGVIFLTAHFGNWELSSFAHGLYGYPLNFAVRKMDNPLLDELINRVRCLSGGHAIEKNDFARQALRALKQGEALGILMDTNMLAAEGVFVDFFGRSASTTTGPARIARKTGAPLVLGLAIWDTKLRKYRLRFEPVEWIHREDPEEEILVNTANFTRLIEEYVRRYPDQWLWVHRRWKTRPPGEPPLYSS
ncbi:MAG TPA: lysophospholipid acyltransferase family protein [Terriglobia bacterium]|nr:lysophospholipid acyltransferase family protein [Terriglobia bacterium]